MIELTQRNLDGSSQPILVDTTDLSSVAVDESEPNHFTILRFKSGNPALWVTESVEEVARRMSEAK
jgi:hypothetical protein